MPDQQSDLFEIVEPLLLSIDGLTAQIKKYDKKIRETTEADIECKRLQRIPGVGPITALTFILTVEEATRFTNPRDIGAWLGLVPQRDQSGKSDKQLPISKAGNRYLRTLLVQAAQYILGHFGPDCDLRRYGQKLAARGGKAAKKKAVIAVARKLSVLLLVLWQQRRDYEPLRNVEALATEKSADAKGIADAA